MKTHDITPFLPYLFAIYLVLFGAWMLNGLLTPILKELRLHTELLRLCLDEMQEINNRERDPRTPRKYRDPVMKAIAALFFEAYPGPRATDPTPLAESPLTQPSEVSLDDAAATRTGQPA
ncbi:MAG: hypothetical protein H0X25_22600 [Acidobacteriales bacterium]|nr:hypothetical protein [Terriglobales bacterium]